VRRELERIEIPDEHEARERAWRVVQAAFAQREPAPRPSRTPWIAAGAVAFAAVVAALASPPGRAVIHRVREAVGIERAVPALFSSPAPGRILVTSSSGAWVVQASGSKRRLGDWQQASWSPFGRFVVVAGGHELATLTPGGDVHWTLARRQPRFPSWGGTRTDTRIAYVSVQSLRVVAGDGTDDRRSCGHAVARVSPAWQPGSRRVLAAAARKGVVSVYAVDTCQLLWRSTPGPVPTKLEWSSDGRRLLVLAPTRLRVYDVRGRVVAQDDPSDSTRDTDATFFPGSHRVVVVRVGAQSDVFVLGGGKALFHVAGALGQVAPSPDGRWLLVTWPGADQWIFVRTSGRGIRAVSNIARQFESPTFPSVHGWMR
jgi:hypothetical protein